MDSFFKVRIGTFVTRNKKGVSDRHPLSYFLLTVNKAGLFLHFFIKESFHLLCDIAEVVFDSKVPGLETM